ncbi:Hypothetical protein FKW44_011422 [Caligus rogercresseyi]|uniref:Uncharacterized protein n=1 Tax=Caligus rogercresseyi TaxID=217165 RepID=A0A7T8HIE2_CALRO|nr:Hypothetical protein FKW44_011422 [Caligus rogercresseyi]
MNKVKDKRLLVLVDETTDRCGRAMTSVLSVPSMDASRIDPYYWTCLTSMLPITKHSTD